MVDVRVATPGDSTVVKKMNAGLREVLLQAGGRESLAVSSSLPGLRAVGLIDHAREEAPQTTKLRPSVLLTALTATLVLPRRAGAGLTGIRWIQGGHIEHIGSAMPDLCARRRRVDAPPSRHLGAHTD